MAALVELTGDFAQAIKLSSQVLATRGHIYPVTNANVSLAARMDDGSLVCGETNITASRQRIVELMLQPENAEPLPETLEAIARADLITVGPGSLYTSIITNLLVKGVADALAHSRATRVYICNLMTQSNESLDLTASQHIQRIYEHTRMPIFDYALVNTAPVSQVLLGPLCRRRRLSDHRGRRRHRSSGSAVHHRRLHSRRGCGAPRCRQGRGNRARPWASRPPLTRVRGRF